MVEGIALVTGSILYLVLKFRAFDATHMFCMYFFTVFIVFSFAVFVVFSASLSIYAVKRVNINLDLDFLP